VGGATVVVVVDTGAVTVALSCGRVVAEVDGEATEVVVVVVSVVDVVEAAGLGLATVETGFFPDAGTVVVDDTTGWMKGVSEGNVGGGA
jgi:hypothetical protein